MLLLACLLAAAHAAPATYDQRQDGGFNVRADVQNVVFVVALPSKMTLPLLDGLIKSAKEPALQERADVRVMEAFVEPSEPYHVEIGEGPDGDGRAVEVVIAGRRRLDSEVQAEAEPDELMLLGATEQCGPGRERDPETLACRARAHNADNQPAQPQPEQKPEPAPAKPEAEQKPQPAKSELQKKPQPAPEKSESEKKPQPAPAVNRSPEVVLVSV